MVSGTNPGTNFLRVKLNELTPKIEQAECDELKKNLFTSRQWNLFSENVEQPNLQYRLAGHARRRHVFCIVRHPALQNPQDRTKAAQCEFWSVLRQAQRMAAYAPVENNSNELEQIQPAIQII